MKSNKFDIREYIKDSKVLSGHEEGEELRKKLNLSLEDSNDEALTIVIKDIYAMKKLESLKTVVAKLFGVTARRVQQLTQDGIISPASEGASGKRYNICAVTQQYIAFLSGKSTGSGKKEQQLKESKLIAEVALKESQCHIRTASCVGY